MPTKILLYSIDPNRFGISGGQGGELIFNTLARGGVLPHEIETLSAPLASYSKLLPPVVVVLGEKSFSSVYPDSSITLGEARGYGFTLPKYPNTTFLATFTPQAAYDTFNYFGADEDDSEGGDSIQRKNFKFWLSKDIAKAARFTTKPFIELVPPIQTMVPIGEMITELNLARNTDLTVDIETDSSYNLTAIAIQVGFRPTLATPCLFQGRWISEDSWRLLGALGKAFQRGNTIIGHNLMFDLFILLWKYGIPAPAKCFDTMLSHSRCMIEVEKSLGACISLYLDDAAYHKAEGVFEPKNFDQLQKLVLYNAKDVAQTARLPEQILKVAEKLGAVDSVNQVNAMIRPYLLMQLQGLRVDMETLLSRADKFTRKETQLKRILNILTGYELNPNSPKQISQYLYNEHTGFAAPEKDATNEKTLYELQLKAKSPAITTILKIRQTAKQGEKLSFNLFPRTPHRTVSELRLTTGYKLARTTTMRLASSTLLKFGSKQEGYGTNTQNFAKELRVIAIPDPGMIFVQVDQSGAEALIVSYLTRHGKFRDLFLNKVKPHCYVALRLFLPYWEDVLGKKLSHLLNSTIPELKAHPDWSEVLKPIVESDKESGSKRYYHLAKKTCHSANYDIKAPTFRLAVLTDTEGEANLSHREAAEFLNLYRELFPEIPSWHKDVEDLLFSTKTIRNLFGYPRVFTGRIHPTMFKEAYAFAPQSTVGTITNIAGITAQKEIEEKSLPWDLLENNHDSLLMQVPLGDEERGADFLKRHMNQPLVSPRGEKFSMKSEASIGMDWYNLKGI